MKKTSRTFIVAFFLLAAGPAFAGSDKDLMKDLTIEAMLGYAKELYQRGQIQEAKRVMARIKELEGIPAKKQARLPAAKIALPLQKDCCDLMLEKSKVVENKQVKDVSTQSLLEAIAAQEALINQLNSDVSALRNQIQAAGHE